MLYWRAQGQYAPELLGPSQRRGTSLTMESRRLLRLYPKTATDSDSLASYGACDPRFNPRNRGLRTDCPAPARRPCIGETIAARAGTRGRLA